MKFLGNPIRFMIIGNLVIYHHLPMFEITNQMGFKWISSVFVVLWVGAPMIIGPCFPRFANAPCWYLIVGQACARCSFVAVFKKWAIPQIANFSKRNPTLARSHFWMGKKQSVQVGVPSSPGRGGWKKKPAFSWWNISRNQLLIFLFLRTNSITLFLLW